jgi:hypothetical protein
MVHAYLAFITHINILANNNNDKFNSQVLQHILGEKKKNALRGREMHQPGHLVLTSYTP